MATRRTKSRRNKSTGAKVVRARPGVTSGRLLEAVTREPGKHPQEYAAVLGISKSGCSSAAAVLKRNGFLRTEGKTMSTRYYPTAKGGKAAGLPEPASPGAGAPKPPRTKPRGRRRPPERNVAAEVNGHIAPEMLAALGLAPTPAALIGDSVLIVNDVAYKITMEQIG